MRGSSDRRAHPRVRCLATVRACGSDGTVEGRATNISEGGMYLQRLTCEPLCPGEQLRLEVDLPDGPVRVMGRVVKPAEEVFYQAGAIAFTALDELDRDRLRRFVGQRGRPRSVLRGAPLARIKVRRAAR
jgi:hypothetical protein